MSVCNKIAFMPEFLKVIVKTQTGGTVLCVPNKERYQAHAWEGEELGQIHFGCAWDISVLVCLKYFSK